MLSVKPVTSVEEGVEDEGHVASRKLSFDKLDCNATLLCANRCSIAGDSHATRTADTLVEARRHGFHPDIAGTGDMNIGFVARRDIDIAAAGDMDIGAPHAGVGQRSIAAAGYGKIDLVDPAAGAHPAAAGNVQTQTVLIQASHLDVAAPAMQ